MYTIVISDIHGSNTELQTMLGYMKEQGYTIGDNCRLVVNGDMIDRGSDNYEVLTTLKQLQKLYNESNVVVLRGNHEDMYLDWLNGGISNYLLYGVNTVDSLHTALNNKQEVELYNYPLKREHIIQGHYDLNNWICNLPTYYEDEHVIVVHGGVKGEYKEWKYNDESEHMWTRDCHRYISNDSGKTLIMGHTPTRVYTNIDAIYQPLESIMYIDGAVSNGGKLLVAVMKQGKLDKELRINGTKVEEYIKQE